MGSAYCIHIVVYLSIIDQLYASHLSRPISSTDALQRCYDGDVTVHVAFPIDTDSGKEFHAITSANGEECAITPSSQTCIDPLAKW